MRTISLSILTLLSTACVYDNNCPDRQGAGSGVTDTASEEGVDSPEYFLSPDASMAGETVILSLQSDQAVDFEAIETLNFFEDISVCTMSARDDELLLTIAIDGAVIPGAVDLIIELEDGSHVFVESGFTVLDPNADEATMARTSPEQAKKRTAPPPRAAVKAAEAGSIVVDPGAQTLVPTSASISGISFGIVSVRFSGAPSVTRMSSSIRMPMPRNRSGASSSPGLM
jgi:hypothetical protein